MRASAIPIRGIQDLRCPHLSGSAFRGSTVYTQWRKKKYDGKWKENGKNYQQYDGKKKNYQQYGKKKRI